MDLRMLIWKFTKLPCIIDFYDPRSFGDKLMFHGVCPLRRCGAVVIIETIDDSSALRITWSEHNDKVEHEMKAKITGNMKSKILDMLQKDVPIVVQSKLVSEFMESTDESCPIIPNPKNLHQMKYRSRAQENDYKENPILAIVNMRACPEFYKCIHEVGYFPFSCFYSTPQQQNITLSESKNKRSCIYIDATGISVTLPSECEISARTNKIKRCMLYSIVMQGTTSNKPVYHMVTQTHTSSQIIRMLKSFMSLQHRDKSPDEVVIDESAALMLACVQAFTSFNSVNEYLNHCYECLEKEEMSKQTLIRIDRSHVIKSIMRNTKLKKLGGAKTVFYRRAIGYILQLESFDEALEFMEELFRCMHEPVLKDNDQNRKKLIELVSKHKSNIEWEDDTENEEESDAAYVCSKRNKFYDLVANISSKHSQDNI